MFVNNLAEVDKTNPRVFFFEKAGIMLGATGRTRTGDLLITNQLLYRLSHSSVLYLLAYKTATVLR